MTLCGREATLDLRTASGAAETCVRFILALNPHKIKICVVGIIRLSYVYFPVISPRDVIYHQLLDTGFLLLVSIIN